MINKKYSNCISSLKLYEISNILVKIDGRFVPSIPISYPTFTQRLKYAWWVFIGNADILL